MPRYVYTKLRVMSLEGPWFRVDQLREAVAELRTVPVTGFTGLAAVTDVMVGKYQYECKPMLQLAAIASIICVRFPPTCLLIAQFGHSIFIDIDSMPAE